jgi:hypothetical protein
MDLAPAGALPHLKIASLSTCSLLPEYQLFQHRHFCSKCGENSANGGYVLVHFINLASIILAVDEKNSDVDLGVQ